MVSRRPRFKLVAPVVRTREAALHRQIADVFRLEIAAPGRRSSHGVIWFSVDLAAYAGDVPGIRTGRGCIAGIPDIFVLHGPLVHLMEVKSEDGRLSDAQQDFAANAIVSGIPFTVVCSAIEALAALDHWKVPRAHRILDTTQLERKAQSTL